MSASAGPWPSGTLQGDTGRLTVIPGDPSGALLGLGVFIAVVIVVVAGAHAKLCPVDNEPG